MTQTQPSMTLRFPLLMGFGFAAGAALVVAAIAVIPTLSNALSPSVTSIVESSIEATPLPLARVLSPTTVAAPTSTSVSSSLPGRHGLSVDMGFFDSPPESWIGIRPYVDWHSGAYRLFARDPAHFVALGAPVGNDLADVIVSARLHKTAGPAGGGYGLMLRTTSDVPLDGANQSFNGYVFEVGDRGEVGIWRRAGDHWVDLVPWTPSTAVHRADDSNELVAEATGNQLTLSVNGVQVARAQDAMFEVGGVGVFVGGDGNQAELDHLAVKTAE